MFSLHSNLRKLFSGILIAFLTCSVNTSAAREDTKSNPPAESAPKKKPSDKRPDPFAPIADDAKLPRVLLIGDSISIGYTLPVRAALAGVANVHRPPENCGPTSRGLEKLDKWLGDKPWDVIHFNFGLHDLKFVNEEGKFDKKNGRQLAPPDQYEKNLSRLVERLRQTGATLIWCSTTPVPKGSNGRFAGDAAKYNAIAARVMRLTLGEDCVVDDLYAFAYPRLNKIQRKANVHFTAAGSSDLGAEVARVIRRNLPSPKPVTAQTATGVVFHDQNNNQKFDPGERPLPGVRVSNGKDIVKTDARGRYRLPVDDDTILFVIKPRNWRTPLSAEKLPRFYYIHKPKGSPKQRYAGVAPTGPLPDSVDFPLTPQQEPERFKAIFFGDTQPRDQKEIDYMSHDVIEELIGTDASFGVTLGDIAFDNLDILEPQARSIALLGIPWYNVIGNHDLNFDAHHDDQSDETFERVFGPSYYSFDHGPVHFLVLDDVEWLIDDKGEGTYQGGLGKKQVEFIKRDLDLIPKDQLVVLMMHIPLNEVRDHQDVFRLIEQRPFSVSISAHEHYHEHRFFDSKDGWRGPKPHHHIVNVTVCGSWWSGFKDERGIPHTLMSQGAPNGYSTITFDGHEYKVRFKAASRPADYQMNIYAPEAVAQSEAAKTNVLVNVFNGSSRSKIEMKIGAGDKWRPMTRTPIEDPALRRVFDSEQKVRELLAARGQDPDKFARGISQPRISEHIWAARLPGDLPIGTHWIHIRSTDMHGQVDRSSRVLRVKP